MSEPVARLNSALEGRYRIESKLGEGGMATVYRADDLKHERKVALKVLKPELAAVVGADRFLAEIKTTANLLHPHLLPLHDSGEADGFLFYVMPYVEGETLRDRLEREIQLPVPEAVRIATDVAEALHAAHEQGVVHRDIKPANILLSRGRPLLADFGIAFAVNAAGGGRLTETGLSLGTPHYMSPEQASADREPSATSDVYSLSCVLYEMLVGDPPHTGSNAQAVLAKILTEEPSSPKTVRPSTPKHVDAAVRRALEKLPADRFRSAQDFGAALADEAFRHGEEEEREGAQSAGLWNRLTVSMAAIILCLFLAIAVLIQGRGPNDEPGVMRLDLDLGALAHDPEGDLVISPDGTLFVVAAELDGQRGLYIRSTDEDRFRPIPGTEGARWPEFSPDGQWIVFRDGGSQSVRKVSVDGGPPLTVVASGVTEPKPAHWLRDGSVLIAADEAVYRVPGDGGVPEVLANINGLVETMEALPNGRGVLLTIRSAVYLYDMEIDSASLLLPEAVDPTYVETGHILFGHPSGGLFGVAFDADQLRLTGQPVPLLDDLWVAGDRAHFYLATNGTLVYGSGRSGDLETQLHLVDFEGGSEPLPIRSTNTMMTPRWSPDGRSIAFCSVEDGRRVIFTYEVEGGGQPRQVTFDGADRNPVWSPNGAHIVYSSIREGTSGFDLFVSNVRGSSPERTLMAAEGFQSPREWLADDVVLYEGGVNAGGTNLWQFRMNDVEEALPYIQTDADLDDVAVSRDGAWAAYQSDETDEEEVYVNSFPVPGRAVRVTYGGGQFPKWAPDGRTLYYWSDEDLPVDTLYAAEVSTSPALAILSRRIVKVGEYSPEDWDLHPTGDHFVVSVPKSVAGPESEGGERFIVVLNFIEELRRLVPN